MMIGPKKKSITSMVVPPKAKQIVETLNWKDSVKLKQTIAL